MGEHQVLKLLHDYWERRSEVYQIADVFGRRIIATYLTKLKPQSLIEVGCGTGELFNNYGNIPYVVGCDWSDGMLIRSQNRIDRHKYGNIHLKKLNIAENYLHEQFDVALTRTCLMHIPPENIETACRNLTKMSKQLLLMEFYEPNRLQPLSTHNWSHPYTTIFKTLNYELTDAYDRPDGLPQILFHFKKASS